MPTRRALLRSGLAAGATLALGGCSSAPVRDPGDIALPGFEGALLYPNPSGYQRARDASPHGRADPPLEGVVLGLLRFMRRKEIVGA